MSCHVSSDKGHTANDRRKDKIKPSDSSRDSYHRSSDYPKHFQVAIQALTPTEVVKLVQPFYGCSKVEC